MSEAELRNRLVGRRVTGLALDKDRGGTWDACDSLSVFLDDGTTLTVTSEGGPGGATAEPRPVHARRG